MKRAILSAAALFDPTLPAELSGLLGTLTDFDALRAGEGRSLDERQAAARTLHERLMRDAAALLQEPADLGPAASASARRAWFAEAVLLWLRFARTSSAPLVDTLGVRTLSDFPLDLPLSDERGAAVLRAALGAAFDWEEGDLAEIERSIDHLTSNLPLKHRLTHALAALIAEGGRLAPAEGGRLTPAGCVELMRSFFGPVPWRPGDVDIVMTSTSLFFCIPIVEETRLGTPDWNERPEAEREAIGGFLARLAAENTAETTRFPAFGHFAIGAINPHLFRALSDAVSENLEVVQGTLATMAVILPTSAVDEYIVHDAWGHTWQEALHEFEWEYALLPHLDAPLVASSGPLFGGPSAPALASAFVARSGRTELAEAALLRFADADLRGRIQVATSAILAEMFADVMESKYTLWRRPESPLPTASLLVGSALKLDLSLGDVHRQLGRWTKPYRALVAGRVSERGGGSVAPRGDGDPGDAARAALAASLASSGALPEAGLAEAVERAGLVMWRELAPAFDGALGAEPAPEGGLRSSVARRIVLQFLLVEAHLERALRESAPGARPHRAEPAWRDPATCMDLYTVAIARFYEHDRRDHFFRLDDAMRSEFQQHCAALKAAIDAQLP